MTAIIRPIGPTYALSVANTQKTAITIQSSNGAPCNYAMFVNSGAVDLCVVLAPFAATPATPTLVFPVDGTPTVPNSFLLRASAVGQPLIVEVPQGGFSISAIGASAGPSIMYITPVNSPN